VEKIRNAAIIAAFVVAAAVLAGSQLYNGGCGPMGPAVHDFQCHQLHNN
jgi:hypothetical protein